MSSPIAELGQAHTQIVEAGGAIVEGVLSAIRIDGALVSVGLDDVSQLWSNGTTPVAGSVSASTSEVSRVDLAFLKELSPGVTGVALLSGKDQLLGLGILGSDGRFREFDPAPSGVLFLGPAANALLDTEYQPLLGVSCQPTERLEASNAVQSLVNYFTILGSETREQRIADLQRLDRVADEIVDSAGPFVDPVTGLDVGAARNDILAQLRAGVDPGQVVVHVTVPIVIRLPSDAATSFPNDALVFTDSQSGRVLSWVPLRPIVSTFADGTQQTSFEYAAYLEPSEKGHNVAVFVRSLNDENFDCSPGPTEQSFLVLPFEDVFGDGRAILDVGAGTYSPMPPRYIQNRNL